MMLTVCSFLPQPHAGLSSKGVQIAAFCRQNLLFLCVPKVVAMVFGPLPRVRPNIYIDMALRLYSQTARRTRA